MNCRYAETAKSLRMYSLPSVGGVTRSLQSWRVQLCIYRHCVCFYALRSVISFFCCMTLVRLKLEFRHSFGVSVPHTVCLPNLKFLHLRHIVFSDNESVQRLFSGCHMLEELLLSHCSQKIPGKFMACSPTLKRLILTSFTDCKELMINALNLVYFKHSNFVVTHYSILNLHSLIEARIDVGLFTVAFFYQTTTPDLLRGISNTRSLHFVTNFYRICIIIALIQYMKQTRFYTTN
ncbi:hypothetical protein ES288_D13G176200v1 [Gossypium darwinii]|uniref:F-box/LRR-repeat protein 15/At3g58940/PEG3-like LRR domain-containing protein n=1 Tax=Gossypium darwinii TaxID=34276 RepID=A0A5D2A2J4_GOSDA|nr:hypothetical protein ES288_D13G176200v1 [Gossypium darwinii]